MDVAHYNANRGIYFPIIEQGGLFGTFWLVGNSYKNQAKMFGAYPPSYLKRIQLLFPEEFEKGWILHLFSGTLQGSERQITFDIRQEMKPDFVGNAEDIDRIFTQEMVGRVAGNSELWEGFDLILADPPYDENHIRYGTKLVNKKKVIKKCATILKPGGHLVWLDTIMPIWSKADGWKLKGTIGLLQSTNHKVRVISILEKVEPAIAPKPKKKRERYGAVKV